MLFRDLLNQALHDKRSEFGLYFERSAAEREYYLTTLNSIAAAPLADVLGTLADADNCGGVPSEEIERHGSLVFEFEYDWQNHEQAREWAADVLAGRTTFAADGSQIFAGRETTLPVAAIQVGWFENPHDASKPYEKNARFEVLSPEDLIAGDDEPLNPETRVGERRFHAEVRRAAEFLSKAKGWRERGERMPLAFFDGTLLVSFALPRTSIQESFIQAMVNLVRHSRECEVPIVGYVDRSFARDLLSLAETYSPAGKPEQKNLFDASVLQSAIVSWGGRTGFFYSRRKGLGAFEDSSTGRPTVGFVYLRTTANSVPVRLDVPAWIFEAGLLDEIVDVVRAECVIGVGYPYALETADQTAVISTRDREVFVRALQDFANREKLEFNISRKNESKGRRR